MPRYLISFDAHAMDDISDEDGPVVADAAHAVVQQAMNAGVWVFRRRAGEPEGEHRGHRRNRHRGPVPGGDRRNVDRRRPLTRGRAGVGRQDRRCLPLCSRGQRVRGGSDGRQLEDPRLGQRSGMTPERGTWLNKWTGLMHRLGDGRKRATSR